MTQLLVVYATSTQPVRYYKGPPVRPLAQTVTIDPQTRMYAPSVVRAARLAPVPLFAQSVPTLTFMMAPVSSPVPTPTMKVSDLPVKLVCLLVRSVQTPPTA